MPQLDIQFYIPQLFWLGITFCFLYLGMRFLIEPRLKLLFEKRERNLHGKLKEIESFKIETEKLKQETDAFVQNIEQEAQKIISEAQHKAAQYFRENEERIHRDLLLKMGQFEEKLEIKKRTLLKDLQVQEAELARELIEKLIKISITEEAFKGIKASSKSLQ